MTGYIAQGYCLIMCLIAAITDVRDKKVYNVLTFPSMILGLALTVLVFRGQLLWNVIITVFLLAISPMMGMGDVKLTIAIVWLCGSQKGIWSLFLGTLYLFAYCFVTQPALMLQTIKDTFHTLTMHTPVIRRSDKKYPLALFIAIGYVSIELAERFLFWNI